MCSIKRFAVFLILVPYAARGQQSQPVGLETILKSIEANNVLLQSYDLKAQSYKYSAEAATAWMPPMIGFGTFMTPYPGQKKIEPRDAGQLMFRIEQAIPNTSKLQAWKKFIESQANVERANRTITMNDLRSQAKRMYYSWLVATRRIMLIKINIALLETMRKVEEVRYPYNQSQLSSVFTLNARLEETQNLIRMQQGEISRERSLLNGLMNEPGNRLFEIDTSGEPVFIPALHDTSSLASSKGDVLKMNQELLSMQLDIAYTKRQKRPDFKIQFDHMYPLGTMMPNQYSIMGMVTIPIAPWSSKMFK